MIDMPVRWVPPTTVVHMMPAPRSLQGFLLDVITLPELLTLFPLVENNKVAIIYFLLCLLFKRIVSICRDVVGPRVCHTEWSKSEGEKEISYINTYIQNLEKWYWWTYLHALTFKGPYISWKVERIIYPSPPLSGISTLRHDINHPWLYIREPTVYS